MSNAALTAVFEHSETRNAARLLMLALADRANEQGRAWPGNKDLMRRTGLSESSVIEAKKKAVALEELHVQRNGGPHRTDLYTLQILDRPDSGPSRIERDTLQIPDPNPPDFGPKPSLTLKNPHSLDRVSRKSKPDEDPDFATFWQAYPRKTAKTNAAKAWRATAQHRPPLNGLLGALEKHKLSHQWQEPRFIPHPATWLNGHRWADELQPAEPVEPQPIRLRL